MFCILTVESLKFQGRNHVFKVGGPIPWSRVSLLFYRKKIDRSTQFGAVGYIITLYSSKSHVKSWGGSGPRTLQWLRPCNILESVKFGKLYSTYIALNNWLSLSEVFHFHPGIFHIICNIRYYLILRQIAFVQSRTICVWIFRLIQLYMFAVCNIWQFV